mmetsp:Transcript_67009/g.158108  ORF Transcript_67009/g.158108 Transcript_67009/m.158108 type:complete len:202 (-) Transcript_67009:352-957(-)
MGNAGVHPKTEIVAHDRILARGALNCPAVQGARLGTYGLLQNWFEVLSTVPASPVQSSCHVVASPKRDHTHSRIPRQRHLVECSERPPHGSVPATNNHTSVGASPKPFERWCGPSVGQVVNLRCSQELPELLNHCCPLLAAALAIDESIQGREYELVALVSHGLGEPRPASCFLHALSAAGMTFHITPRASDSFGKPTHHP